MSSKARMFGVGFCVLFFELFCIRWFPAQIRHLGYFTNFVLLAAFLGLGAGTLWGQRKGSLLSLFPGSLLAVLGLTQFAHLEIQIQSPDVIYFQNSQPDATSAEPLLLLPLLFAVLVWLFVCLASELGPLFAELEPLVAYRANLLGSLAGILLFTLCSWLWLSAAWWMLITVVGLLLLLPGDRWRAPQAVLLVLALGLVAVSDRGTIWSPYYKIEKQDLIYQGKLLGYNIRVNNTGHQMLVPGEYLALEPMYGELYRAFPEREFERLLILGAGGGRDTAFALSRGTGHIDAVEIDPVLLDFGRKLHPDRPYLDPRVTTHNQDGRTFLSRSQERYDCVIFALPDSLVLASSYANLRLESYLFTLESFTSVKRLLKPDGVFVLYNGYRKPWLVDKLAGMLELVFGARPTVVTFDDATTCILAGPGAAGLAQSSYQPWPAATDDWPFLYLKHPSFPRLYIWSILAVLLVAGVALAAAGSPAALRGQPLFFCLGAAFMLLETRSVVSFALLYGSTWYVNAVVFAVILTLVLVAVEVTSRYRLPAAPLYVALCLSLVANYVVGVDIFLANDTLRDVVAPFFYLLPIFLANLAFTNDFRDSHQAYHAYAANMVGSVCGGMAEYASMLTGYRNLLLVALGIYLMAWWLAARSRT